LIKFAVLTDRVPVFNTLVEVNP